MPVLRVVTDIMLREEPTATERRQASERMKEFAAGVITSTVFEDEGVAEARASHIHLSTEDRSCNACRKLAQDLVGSP